MKKTSIKKNNELKEKFLVKLMNLTYTIEKTNLNPHLTKEERADIVDKLQNLYDDLDTALGTGNEIIDLAVNGAEGALKAFKNAIYYGLKNEINYALAALSLAIDVWISSLEGNLVNGEKEKEPYARAKLNRKLEELNDIIAGFAESSSRIDEDIRVTEQSVEELNEAILNEDNERKINDLYRQVTTTKAKLDTLNIRKSSYNACYNLLDLIRANVKEIVSASKYSTADLNKAKAFLNIAKLKAVLAEPEKALNILKMMNKELDMITNKVKMIDSKILSTDGNSVAVNEDALRYKEELMAKKRAKDALKELDEISPNENKETKKVEGRK